MRSESRLGEAAFAGLLAALGVFAGAQTTTWPVKAALYPRVMSAALVLSALGCAALAILGKAGKASGPVDLEFESDLPDEVVRRRTLGALGWIGGFLFAGWLVGLIPAMVLLVLAYLGWVGRERWWFVGTMTAATWVGLEAFLVRLLHLPIPTGVLPSLLVR